MPRAASAFLLVCVLVGAGSLAPGSGALACGLEDASSIGARQGALAMAYPRSLQVGTAVWQAQLAGSLPPDPVARREDLSPEARAKLRGIRASTVLRQLATRLGGPEAAALSQNLAVVLLGPVMWNRFEVRAGQVQPLLHVEGPEPGDVIAVTELAVMEAIAAGRLGFAEAMDRGVLRLYGEPAGIARVLAWRNRQG